MTLTLLLFALLKDGFEGRGETPKSQNLILGYFQVGWFTSGRDGEKRLQETGGHTTFASCFTLPRERLPDACRTVAKHGRTMIEPRLLYGGLLPGWSTLVHTVVAEAVADGAIAIQGVDEPHEGGYPRSERAQVYGLYEQLFDVPLYCNFNRAYAGIDPECDWVSYTPLYGLASIRYDHHRTVREHCLEAGCDVVFVLDGLNLPTRPSPDSLRVEKNRRLYNLCRAENQDTDSVDCIGFYVFVWEWPSPVSAKYQPTVVTAIKEMDLAPVDDPLTVHYGSPLILRDGDHVHAIQTLPERCNLPCGLIVDGHEAFIDPYRVIREDPDL